MSPQQSFKPKLPKPLQTLPSYIEVAREKYNACLDTIDTSLKIDGVSSTLRFHHVRFDTNGQPKFRDLAECLADHLIEYCFSAQRRGTPKKPNEYTRLSREARNLLRKWGQSGESGEILLYFLLDSVIGAPQMVAKIDLKTNPKLEVNGSDGIHMRWHPDDEVLDIYFGESKLEKTVASAIKNAFISMENFHADGLRDHEFGLVTSHFKWADPKLQKAIKGYLDRQSSTSPDCRINHACLIGYDWNDYAKLGGNSFKEVTSEFKNLYINDAPRIHKLLASRFDTFSQKHLRFELFLLPFKSVQEFRDAFNQLVL